MVTPLQPPSGPDFAQQPHPTQSRRHECFRRVNSGGECGAPPGVGGRKARRQGVPQEAFQPGDLDFPRSLPPRAPLAPLFSPSGNTPSEHLGGSERAGAGGDEARGRRRGARSCSCCSCRRRGGANWPPIRRLDRSPQEELVCEHLRHHLERGGRLGPVECGRTKRPQEEAAERGGHENARPALPFLSPHSTFPCSLSPASNMSETEMLEAGLRAESSTSEWHGGHATIQLS